MLAPEPSSGRRARAAVADWLRDLARPELAESASLVVAELVANAVKHGGPHIELDLTATKGAIRIAVFDSGRTVPDLTPQRPNPTRQDGRGTLMIDRLASRWGYEPAPAGKIVWAELDVRDGRQPPSI